MIEIKNALASASCKKFEEQKLVCPVNLRKGLFTVGALDNIDHNPSATTAKGSFHGTGISMFQFSTLSNPGISQESLVTKPSSSRKIFLPDSYTNVPAVSCKTDSLTVSEYVPPHECISVLNEGKLVKKCGLNIAFKCSLRMNQ